MKNVVIGLFFAITCLIMACKNAPDQTTEQQQAWDNIMTVHDEVMPKTADINRMTTQLRAKLATFDSTQQATKNDIMNAIQALETADEGMMSWMSEVQNPEILRSENKTHAEIMRYLNDEKIKVDKVRDDMLAALERGRQLLANTSAPVPDSTSQQ